MKSLVNGAADRLSLLSVFSCMALSILLFITILVKTLYSNFYITNFSAFQWINPSLISPLAVQIQISQIFCLHRGHFSCPDLQGFNGWDPRWENKQNPSESQDPVVLAGQRGGAGTLETGSV